MPDLAVILSCGVSNLADPNQWALQCVLDETCPHSAIADYLNIPDSAPRPPTGSDLVLAQDASPTQWLHVGMCPFWAMCSSKDVAAVHSTLWPEDHNERGILNLALLTGQVNVSNAKTGIICSGPDKGQRVDPETDIIITGPSAGLPAHR
jgi:hypothetical protein